MKKIIFLAITIGLLPFSFAQTFKRNYEYRCSAPAQNLKVNSFSQGPNFDSQLEILFTNPKKVIRGYAKRYSNIHPGTRLTLKIPGYEFSTLDAPLDEDPQHPGYPIVSSQLNWKGNSVPISCVFCGWQLPDNYCGSIPYP